MELEKTLEREKQRSAESIRITDLIQDFSSQERKAYIIGYGDSLLYFSKMFPEKKQLMDDYIP